LHSNNLRAKRCKAYIGTSLILTILRLYFVWWNLTILTLLDYILKKLFSKKTFLQNLSISYKINLLWWWFQDSLHYQFLSKWSFFDNVSLHSETFDTLNYKNELFIFIWNLNINLKLILLFLNVSFKTFPHPTAVHFLGNIYVRIVVTRYLHNISIRHRNLETWFGIP